MSEQERLLSLFLKGVQFPKVSGFEVLELLDVRSKIAQMENSLTEAQKEELEKADSLLIEHASEFYTSVSELGDLAEVRRRASVPRSHWWWYLEKLIRVQRAEAEASIG